MPKFISAALALAIVASITLVAIAATEKAPTLHPRAPPPRTAWPPSTSLLPRPPARLP